LVLFVLVMSIPHNPLRDLAWWLSPTRRALTGGLAIVNPPSLGVPMIGELIIVGSLVPAGYCRWTFVRDDVGAYSRSREIAHLKS
jgi:hypothetical protein